MANNNLSTLPDLTTILPVNTTREIYVFMHENPFHCDADLAWLAEKHRDSPYGLNYNGFYMQEYYADMMECHTPYHLEGAEIWRLDPKHFYHKANPDKETVSGGIHLKASIMMICLAVTLIF